MSGPDDKPDMVNKPPHYLMGDIECIDAIEASMSREAFKGYCKGQVERYLWRYEKKEDPLQDVEKGLFYLQRLKKKLIEEQGQSEE